MLFLIHSLAVLRDVADIVEREKERHRAAYLASDLSRVTLHRTSIPLMLTLTGCLGQCAQRLARKDRVCEVCHSRSVEDEHHFVFDCSAYAHIWFPALFHSPDSIPLCR